MIQISEQKALEAYPIDIIPDDDTMGFTSSDRNEIIRFGYIKGYDQAFQDFLEKACEWLMHNNDWHDGEVDFYIKNFKNYMQDEM